MHFILVSGGLLTGCTPTGATPAQDSAGRDAGAVVERAAHQMGGLNALRAVRQVQLDVTVQWQRTGFRDVPGSDRPSFETTVDQRDYELAAWRNTRAFGPRTLTQLVSDSVAMQEFGNGWQPLNIAYVDERDELFMYTPDRLVVMAAEAGDLRVAGDTVIAGETFIRVHATLGKFAATILFEAGTGLPAMVRFRAGHPNDFGLVPWGEMWVEVWYSNWRTFDGISIPTQTDVFRVGRPYKRMTVTQAVFNPEIPVDSFTVPPNIREKFLATSVRAMHDRPVDTVVFPQPQLAQIRGFGTPTGAVEIGGRWLLLGGAQADLSMELGLDALSAVGITDIAGALITSTDTRVGGVPELVRRGIPLYVSEGAEAFVRKVLENAGQEAADITVVRRMIRVPLGEAEVLLGPVDLPDNPRSMMIYAPDLKWLYVDTGAAPQHRTMALEMADKFGWAVASLGTARVLSSSILPESPTAPPE